MKSIKLETKKIVDAYKILENAKYQKLDDSDKVKTWKVSRKLGPIAEKYDADAKDAQKKLLPSEDFPELLKKALAYEKMPDEEKKNNPSITQGEYLETVAEWKKYNKLVESALKELNEKEEELEFEPLSEDAFGKLMASNDWTLKQVDMLEFLTT